MKDMKVGYTKCENYKC